MDKTALTTSSNAMPYDYEWTGTSSTLEAYTSTSMSDDSLKLMNKMLDLIHQHPYLPL